MLAIPRVFMKTFKLFQIFFIVFTTTVMSALAMDRLEVEYTPIRSVKGGQALPIEITLSNFSGVPVREVWVYFRYSGDGKFNARRLNSEGFRYYASLRFDAPQENLIEYYFGINYMDEKRETYPSDAASGNLFRASLQTTRNFGNDVVIISPEQGEQIFASDVVITASFGRIAEMVDPEKSKLYLDTWEISRYVLKYQDFISFAPRKVPSGRHKIRLELFDKNENLVASKEWYFTAIPVLGVPRGGEEFTISGRFFAETRQEQLLDHSLIDNYNQSGLHFRGGIGNFSFGARAYLNNREDSGRQPINRFSGFGRLNFWNQRYFNLSVGDAYPKLNPLILQNILLRGFHSNLFLKFFNLDVAYGKTLRAINAVTHTDNQSNIVVDRFGTYQRNILAVRPSFGSARNFQLGFTFLKGEDDTTSVNYGSDPQENAAAGADLFVGLDNQRITFEGNIDASVLNRNITGGSVDFDTLKKSIEDLDEKFYDLATKVITINPYIIPRPNIAYQARLRLRYFRNSISFLYESVDENYLSFGQPYLLRDNRGFHIVDNVNLISNQVFLTVGFRQYHNNLQDVKSTTTDNTNVYANISYYPVKDLPQFTIGFNNYSRNNGISADSLSSLLYRPEDNRTNTINVTAGYPFQLQSLKNRIGINFLNYSRNDIFKETESNSDYLMVNFRTEYAFPLRTLLEFIIQNTESGKGTLLESQLKLTSFGGGVQYILPNVLGDDRLLLKANARLGKLETATYNYNRNYFSFKINYSLPKYGNIGLAADILNYSGDRDYNDFIYSARYDVSF